MFRTLIAMTVGIITMLTAAVASAEPTKVGFVYLTTPGDHGWTYAHELGRQMVENISVTMLSPPMLKTFLKGLMQHA